MNLTPMNADELNSQSGLQPLYNSFVNLNKMPTTVIMSYFPIFIGLLPQKKYFGPHIAKLLKECAILVGQSAYTNTIT